MGLLDTFSFLDDVRRMDKRQVGISSAFLPNVEVQVMRSNNASSHISPDGFLASITLLSLVIDINIAWRMPLGLSSFYEIVSGRAVFVIKLPLLCPALKMHVHTTRPVRQMPNQITNGNAFCFGVTTHNIEVSGILIIPEISRYGGQYY